MNYQETTQWMFNQLPMYQTQGASAYKEDLCNTQVLMQHLNNPHQKIKCIHVAGTNGKGSTSHMLASILQEAGYKVGLYTSPHLKDFRERIKINGEPIAEEFVCNFIENNKTFFEATDMSFFEMSVGLAFDYFNKQTLDIAVVEVGMGGRLDATNVIVPLVSVITNIGMDHVQFLGNTLEKIAFEKAGIIKPAVPVVVGEYVPQTRPVFLSKAKACASAIFFASDLIEKALPSGLLGDYQLHNIKTVMQTIRVLKAQNEFVVSDQNLQVGLLQVIENTKLQGRWQQLGTNPNIVCDTAHNKNGLEIVLLQIQKQNFEKLHFVFGVVNDKDLDSILGLFPKNALYYFCKPNNLRGLDAQHLQEKSSRFGLKGAVYSSVSKAYEMARENATAADFIFVGGSTFVVAEIL